MTGPKGELRHTVVEPIRIAQEDGRPGRHPADRPWARTGRCTACRGAWSPTWSRAVSAGFARNLEIVGVGYRAQLKGQTLEMAVGYSHPVTIEPPEGIAFEVPAPTQVVVRGIDKQAVGEIAAQIRAVRPPEPYKGKGDPLRGRGRSAQGR